MAFYKRAVRRLCNDAPNLATLKVYLYLASKQTYQKFVMVGRKALVKELNLHINTVVNALKWLKENQYLQEHEIDGNTGWLMNPNITTMGANMQKSKSELWHLQKQKELAELERDIEVRQDMLATIDSLIAKNLIEGEFGEEEEESEDYGIDSANTGGDLGPEGK